MYLGPASEQLPSLKGAEVFVVDLGAANVLEEKAGFSFRPLARPFCLFFFSARRLAGVFCAIVFLVFRFFSARRLAGVFLFHLVGVGT